jgi:hypothetical protein
VLLRGPSDDDPHEAVRMQVTAADQATAGQILDQIRALAIRHNVYRGQVISFDADAPGLASGSAAGFLDRPRLDRATVILPPDLLDKLQSPAWDRPAAGELWASGQHQGGVLHGPRERKPHPSGT